MKIAIIGSNGQSGRAIAAEARNRGHEVTGFGRSASDAVDVVKDVLDLTAEDLAGFDVVVDALGFWTEDSFPLHTTTVQHLADLLAGTDARLIVVGGAGSLYLDEDHSLQLFQSEGFPAEFQPLAAAQAAQLASLRPRVDVNWTYVSPAAEYEVSLPRTGEYALAGEVFETNADGVSEISYADYAIAIVDEAESAAHPQQRISVHSR